MSRKKENFCGWQRATWKELNETKRCEENESIFKLRLLQWLLSFLTIQTNSLNTFVEIKKYIWNLNHFFSSATFIYIYIYRNN